MSQDAALAIFIYNRPDHLRRTLVSLKECSGFDAATIFVFGDGPKNQADARAVMAARAVAEAELLGRAHFFYADVNLGLSRSITDGVSSVLAKHERVIVVEDDLQLSPGFLVYMNTALDRYAHSEQVYQISGYSPFGPEHSLETAVLLPWTSTWGWGTWRHAWAYYDPEAQGWEAVQSDRILRYRFNLDGAYDYAHMLALQMGGRRDSWGIRWYWAVFKRNGLVCYPPCSMVLNKGFDGSGTHGRGVTRNFSGPEGQSDVQFVGKVLFPLNACLDEGICKRAKRLTFQRNGGLMGRFRDVINRVLRR